MYHQSHGWFGLLGIGNFINQVLPNHLVVLALQNLARSAQEAKSSTEGCAKIW